MGYRVLKYDYKRPSTTIILFRKTIETSIIFARVHQTDLWQQLKSLSFRKYLLDESELFCTRNCGN